MLNRFVFEPKENHVADHVTVVIADDILLGLVRTEILECVDAEVGQQLQGVRTFHIHVGHVIRLVEQNARLLPGALLIPPVRVFGRHHGIYVRPCHGIAQQLHRRGFLQERFQAAAAHSEHHQGVLACERGSALNGPSLAGSKRSL